MTTDQEIISRIWRRDEDGLHDLSVHYGGLVRSIARNILGNAADADECANDTWLAVWKAIPPQSPRNLAAFVGRIARNKALDRYRRETADKRGGLAFDAVLEELAGCLPSGSDPMAETEDLLMNEWIDRFLHRYLTEDDCDLFLCRYWYGDSIADLARDFGQSRALIATRLYRIREKLKDRLQRWADGQEEEQ